jgi:excisionase family DNA binding protein
MEPLLTTTQAAERLGVSRRRVLAMIRSGRLRAERIGRDWLIAEADLALVQERKPGRPPAMTVR